MINNIFPINSNYIIGGKNEDKIRIYNDKLDLEKQNFLQNIKVSNLFPENRNMIITIPHNSSVSEAFHILIYHKISSAPVYNQKKGIYLGFIDMLDILYCVINYTEENFSDKEQIQRLIEDKLTNKTKCFEIINTSQRNLWYPIEENACLKITMEIMVQHNIHRVPIVDGEGSLITVITQSHVVSLIDKNIDQFNFKNLTLEELKLGFKTVQTVKLNQITIEAFKKIYLMKVTGVAVIDDDINLIGNISASDLKFMGEKAQNLERLFLSIEDFLKIISKNNSNIIEPICVQSSSTFQELIKKIVSTKKHRIYLISENKKLIGVISLVDILRFILEHS